MKRRTYHVPTMKSLRLSEQSDMLAGSGEASEPRKPVIKVSTADDDYIDEGFVDAKKSFNAWNTWDNL